MKIVKNKSVFLRRRNAKYLFKYPYMDYNNPKVWQQAVHQYAVDYADSFKPGCLVSDPNSIKTMGMVIGPVKKRRMKVFMRDGGTMMRTKYYAQVRWMYDYGTPVGFTCDEILDIVFIRAFRPWRGFYQQKESALQAEPTPV